MDSERAAARRSSSFGPEGVVDGLDRDDGDAAMAVMDAAS
jgi:hypothetical protein